MLYRTVENYQQAFALANVMLPEEWCSFQVSIVYGQFYCKSEVMIFSSY